MRSEGFYVNDKSSDTSWVQTSDLSFSPVTMKYRSSRNGDYCLALNSLYAENTTAQETGGY